MIKISDFHKTRDIEKIKEKIKLLKVSEQCLKSILGKDLSDFTFSKDIDKQYKYLFICKLKRLNQFYRDNLEMPWDKDRYYTSVNKTGIKLKCFPNMYNYRLRPDLYRKKFLNKNGKHLDSWFNNYYRINEDWRLFTAFFWSCTTYIHNVHGTAIKKYRLRL